MCREKGDNRWHWFPMIGYCQRYFIPIGILPTCPKIQSKLAVVPFLKRHSVIPVSRVCNYLEIWSRCSDIHLFGLSRYRPLTINDSWIVKHLKPFDKMSSPALGSISKSPPLMAVVPPGVPFVRYFYPLPLMSLVMASATTLIMITMIIILIIISSIVIIIVRYFYPLPLMG